LRRAAVHRVDPDRQLSNRTEHLANDQGQARHLTSSSVCTGRSWARSRQPHRTAATCAPGPDQRQWL